MASAPAFAVTPRLAHAYVTAANTGFDGTGTIVDVITGAASGTRINEVVIQSTGDPADSLITLFIYDPNKAGGAGYAFFDSVDMGNPAAGSTTVSPYRTRLIYDNLVLPSASYKLAAAITVALTAGGMNIWALAADL